jgi:hypothetical protein
MRIRVETDNPAVALGFKQDVPAGVRVVVPPVTTRKSIDSPEALLEVIVETARDVEIGLLSAWLYDKVRPTKGRVRVQINSVEVLCEEGEIWRVITEQIHREHSE